MYSFSAHLQQLQLAIQPAYEQAVASALDLLKAADGVKDQQPPVDCSSINKAAAGVLESTMKVKMVGIVYSSQIIVFCLFF